MFIEFIHIYVGTPMARRELEKRKKNLVDSLIHMPHSICTTFGGPRDLGETTSVAKFYTGLCSARDRM